MTAATLPRSPWHHEQAESPDKLITRLLEIAADHRLPLSPSRASRLVRGELRRHSVTDAERTLLAYVLAYADPTGETAARNVDGGRHAND